MLQLESISEIDCLADEIGNFIEYWGFKHIHGRIWLHLFISKVPLDAPCLRKRLKVSKALISISLKDLMKFEVVEIVGKSSEGTLLYRSNPHLQKVVCNILRSREQEMISKIRDSQKKIEGLDNSTIEKMSIDLDRVKEMATMTGAAENFLNSLVAAQKIESLQSHSPVQVATFA